MIDILGSEELKLLADKQWRLNNLYYIQTKEKRMERMQLKDAQSDFLTRRTKKSFILKSRRIGFSTACLIDMLDDTITTPNMNSAILAHERDKVVVLFEVIKRAYDRLPDFMKPVASYDNRNELYFPELGSKIYVTMDARSQTVHNLHVSELAFITDSPRILGSLESVPDSGKITYETTANGMSGYAYEEWSDSHSEFSKFFYPWYVDPDCAIQTGRSMEEILADYDPLWKQYGLIPNIAQEFNLTTAQMEFYISRIRRQREKVVQEYPTTAIEAFMASGRGVFHPSDLQKHRTEPPLRRSGDLLIWEEPLPGFSYVLGIDPSEGTGNDNSVIVVLNANTGKQAAEYANNRIQADELATVSVNIARDYNHALIVPEINSPALISHLRRLYSNVYRRETIDQLTQKKTKALGWRTTAQSKRLLVEELEEATRTQDIQVMSESSVKELTTFVRTDDQGKQGYGGEGQNHDDRVIALGLAVQGMKESPRMRRQDNKETIAKRKLDAWIKQKNLERNFPKGSNDPPSVAHRKRYALRGSGQSK